MNVKQKAKVKKSFKEYFVHAWRGSVTDFRVGHVHLRGRGPERSVVLDEDLDVGHRPLAVPVGSGLQH